MEIFKRKWSELSGERFDAEYYKDEYYIFNKKIQQSNFKYLNEIVEPIKNGSTPSNGKFENEGIPYFRSQDLNLYDSIYSQYITQDFHKSIIRSKVIPKDILVAVVGATIGKIGFISNNVVQANINQNIAKLRVNSKEIKPKYLAIFLDSSLGQGQIFRLATITTQAYINNFQLGKMKIPLPPLETQQHIIDIMDNAYSLKKQKEQEAKELLDSIDKYLLDELGITLPNPQTHLQNRIWTAKFSELSGARFDPNYHQNYYKQLELALKNGKYPISKLKYVGLMINGSLIPDYFYTTQKTKRAYIRIKDLSFNQEIDFGTLVYINDNFRATQETIVEEKDIVFATIGATIGKANMVPKELKGSFISNNTSKFTLLDNVKNNILFFESFFKSILFQEFIKNKTTITAQPKITNQDILNLKIPLPPLAIQEKIAEEIQKRKQKALKLTEEAKGLLEQAKKQVESMILGK